MNLDHQQLRLKIVESLPNMIRTGRLEDFEWFKPNVPILECSDDSKLLDLTSSDSSDSIKDWMENMSKDGVDCDEIFLKLAGYFLNRKIIIYPVIPKTPNGIIDEYESFEFEPFHILQHSETQYYQSIRPKSETILQLNKDLAKMQPIDSPITLEVSVTNQNDKNVMKNPDSDCGISRICKRIRNLSTQEDTAPSNSAPGAENGVTCEICGDEYIISAIDRHLLHVHGITKVNNHQKSENQDSGSRTKRPRTLSEKISIENPESLFCNWKFNDVAAACNG